MISNTTAADQAAKERWFAFLASREEHRKPRRCRRKLIKPMLKHLPVISDEDFKYAIVHVPKLVRIIEGKAIARDELREFCESRCGRCKLGTDPASWIETKVVKAGAP